MEKYKLNLLSSIILIGLLSLFSCTEEEIIDKNSGKMTTINLSFQAPEVEKIITKADGGINGKKLIQDIRLFIFDTEGNVVYNNSFNIGSDENKGIIASDIPITTGLHYVFAIANTSGSSFASVDDLNGVSDKDDLFNKVARLSGRLSLTGNIVPMVGVIESADGSVQISEGATYTISLERIVSSIQFKVLSGSGKFDLKSYEVVNYPTTTTLWESNTPTVAPKNNWNEGTITNAKTEQTFEFYMFENKQNTSGISSYEGREEKENSNEVGTFVNFKNAPAAATYVILKGRYTGPATVGGTTGVDVSADVTYYVHLGNTNDRQYNNFETLRNKEYIYTATINGVNNIVVEVEQNDKPYDRGDGSISLVGNTFNLDSHFEFFNVTIPVSTDKEYYMDDKTKKTFDWYSFRVYESEVTHKYALYPGEEKNWVEVMPYMIKGNQTYNSSLITNIDQLNVVLKDLAEKGENEVTLTCFVDENLGNNYRESLVFRSDASGNGSSIVTEGVRLRQDYMRKFFSHEGKGYGWETFNETGALAKKDVVGSGTTDKFNGWTNTKTVVGNTWPSASEMMKFQKACMSRNRDENGDGEISDSERKWYLPAINQYIGAWMGADALQDARLYTSDAMEYLHYVSSTYLYHKEGNSYMILWSEEGSAFGRLSEDNSNAVYQLRCIRNFDGGDNTPDVTPANYYDLTGGVFTMYIENAGYRDYQGMGELSTKGGHNGADNKLYSKFQMGDVKGGGKLSFSSQKSLADKNQSVCSENGKVLKDDCFYYPTNYMNTKYSYFRYVGKNKGQYGWTKWWPREWIEKKAGDQDYIKIDESEAYEYNRWRLPNQRELSMMVIAGQLSGNHLSRTITSFDYAGHNNKRGFMYSENVYLSNIYKSGADELNDGNKSVRCVRDAK